METKQTAVEWFAEQCADLFSQYMDKEIMEIDFANGLIESEEQAKQMEKEQIKDAFTDGCIGELYELNAYYTSEKYYNETYGNHEKN